MALKIERFQPEGMNVRMSGGQPSYSHVVTVSGTGKIVYILDGLARFLPGANRGTTQSDCPHQCVVPASPLKGIGRGVVALWSPSGF